MKNKIKEIIYILTISLFFYYILNNNQYITQEVSNSINIWIKKIIPTLFPTFILVDLIYNSNIPYYINKFLKINYIYPLSIISGSPSNAYIINKYNIDKTKLLSTTKYTSLIFSYINLKNIFSKNISILLIVLNIISNLILIFIIKPEKIDFSQKQDIKITKTITSSISKNINTLLSILGTIIFINILPINNINNGFIKTLLLSITEITTSLNNLSSINLPLNIKLFFTIISLSTCGICIELQIKSITSDTSINYKKYIIYRLLHLIIFLLLSIPILIHIQN